MARTDHSSQVTELRRQSYNAVPPQKYIVGTAADLLEMHDATGISLDNWPNAREMVEYFLSAEITKNGA